MIMAQEEQTKVAPKQGASGSAETAAPTPTKKLSITGLVPVGVRRAAK
jgi:hypothetical protein